MDILSQAKAILLRSSRWRRRRILIGLVGLGLILVCARLMALRRPVDLDEPEFECEEHLDLVGEAFLAGIPAFGATVRIQADQVRLLFTSRDCGEIYHPLRVSPGSSDDSFEWNLVRPAGSNAVLVDGDTLHPSVTIDAVGEYRIELVP